MREIRNAFATILLAVIGGTQAAAQPPAALAPAPRKPSEMTFFITSISPGKGGDLGGLAGADGWCQKLATAAGSQRTNWRAYLSTQAVGSAAAINARDRIGSGPWRNARGVIIARNVEELHGINNLNKQTGLDEHGNEVNGRFDKPPKHDILTGSTLDGRAYPPGKDRTCHNYTSSSVGGIQMGHHDRDGPSDSPTGTSWNSAHLSKGAPETGCAQDEIVTHGGMDLFYCFAPK